MSSIGNRIHRAFNRSLRVALRPLVIVGMVFILLSTVDVNDLASPSAWIVLIAIGIVLSVGFLTRRKESDIREKIDDKSGDSQSSEENTISASLVILSFLARCVLLLVVFFITYFLILFAPCVFQLSPETLLFLNRLRGPVLILLVLGIPCLATAAVGWATTPRKPRTPPSSEPPENPPLG